MNHNSGLTQIGQRRATKGLVAILLAVLVLVLLTGVSSAGGPMADVTYYNGELIDTVSGFHHSGLVPGDPGYQGLYNVAAQHYAFFASFDPPALFQQDIISVAPGDPGYSTWWHFNLCFALDGRDLAEDPYTSEAAILEAMAGGNVACSPSGFLFRLVVMGDEVSS
jgi:hypothetical protein